MTRPLTQLIDLLGACWVLLTLAIQSRFNLSSNYWKWRLNTAFPPENSPTSRPQRLRLTLEYARWAFRIRRLR